MKINTISWKHNKIRIINQCKLPSELSYIEIKDLKSLWGCICKLQVRGAPALGAAAALGVYLGVKDSKAKSWKDFSLRLNQVAKYVGASRPTARNLFWGIERVCKKAYANKDKPVSVIKRIILGEAKEIIAEDKAACRKIGFYGSKLVPSNSNIMTICNAGALATIDYGTALGVIYRAKEEGKKPKVFSCESRPLLQGSRLSAWELYKKGVDVTLISDNTAAKLMADGKIDLIIVGADRISANGDSANKIGTFNLAILAKFHKVPFYIAAPSGTFDLKCKTGKDIVIEMRPQGEIIKIMNKRLVAPKNSKVLNPAFDVTLHNLISAIITEKGIIKPPYNKNIRKVILGGHKKRVA